LSAFETVIESTKLSEKEISQVVSWIHGKIWRECFYFIKIWREWIISAILAWKSIKLSSIIKIIKYNNIYISSYIKAGK
jgi:hypothetical protein